MLQGGVVMVDVEFDSEVYDLDVEVKFLDINEGRVNLALTVTAEMDFEDLKKLEPLFKRCRRIKQGCYDVWSLKLKFLREEKYEDTE